MVEKCSICGKSSIFGIILKCSKCNQKICHRHDREQFRAINCHLDPEVTPPLESYTTINYPSKESASKSNFECYKCRTGLEPKDMGERKLHPLDIFPAFLILSMVVVGVIFSFVLISPDLGYSAEQSNYFFDVCLSVVVIDFIIIVLLGWYLMKKYKII